MEIQEKSNLKQNTKYNTAAVRLGYYDKINSEKVRSSAIDDL